MRRNFFERVYKYIVEAYQGIKGGICLQNMKANFQGKTIIFLKKYRVGLFDFLFCKKNFRLVFLGSVSLLVLIIVIKIPVISWTVWWDGWHKCRTWMFWLLVHCVEVMHVHYTIKRHHGNKEEFNLKTKMPICFLLQLTVLCNPLL